MTDEPLINSFSSLFDGRRTAIGTEDGGSLKVYGNAWPSFIERHLTRGGGDAIGVYPLVCNSLILHGEKEPIGWQVRWGCVDFDEGEADSWRHAMRLQAVLAKVGVKGWIERSRSKGYHVWVFGDWTLASTVRRGLLKACEIVGAPTKEINPKSEGFDNPETLGNYVRLPYPGWLGWDSTYSTVKRVVVNEHGNHIPLHDFIVMATDQRGMAGLEKLAALWAPPKPPVQRQVNEIQDEDLEDAIARVHKRTIHILMDGPAGERDRSSTLFWLAQLLVRDGLHTYDEVVALLKYADMRWGKFHERPDFERRITDCADKAWEEHT